MRFASSPLREPNNRIMCPRQPRHHFTEGASLVRGTNGYLLELLLTEYRKSFNDLEPNGTIADLGDVVGGATPSKKNKAFFTASGIAWITPRDLSGTTNVFIGHGATDITRDGFDSCSTKLMPQGSVLFSSRAPVGYVAIASNSVCTNQGFKSAVPRPEVGAAFIYCFLKLNAKEIEKAGSGTTFIEVSGKTMKSFPAPVPTVDASKWFSAQTQPLLNSIRSSEKEAVLLAQLRDALLPKLMSGEIDVSKVELPRLG